jgi:hypothetical protein
MVTCFIFHGYRIILLFQPIITKFATHKSKEKISSFVHMHNLMGTKFMISIFWYEFPLFGDSNYHGTNFERYKFKCSICVATSFVFNANRWKVCICHVTIKFAMHILKEEIGWKHEARSHKAYGLKCWLKSATFLSFFWTQSGNRPWQATDNLQWCWECLTNFGYKPNLKY